MSGRPEIRGSLCSDINWVSRQRILIESDRDDKGGVTPQSRLHGALSFVGKTWVQSLGREDPLEKGMANHSSLLAWRIPWTEEPGGLQSMGSQRVGHNRARTFSVSLSFPICSHTSYKGVFPTMP